jgi:urease accessory protein
MNVNAIKLWQLISPALPVGAYSYSQALEHVIDAGDVTSADDALDWMRGLLRCGIGKLDLPMLARVHRAWAAGDAAETMRLCRRIVALRETSELRLEDLAMGGALAQLLPNLGAAVPEPRLPFAGAFAIAAAHWDIAVEDACAGYAWTWCEAQVAAAVKLVPLGHTAGQRLLLALGEDIPGIVAGALQSGDDDIGFSMPGFAIASSLHETQYSRLFRS